MGGSRTRLYAVLARVSVLGVYFYIFRTFPALSAGLIGAILGFAGGIYLDRSRTERSLVDNFAAGLVLSAILRLADVRYGITLLTPQSYRLGLLVISLAVIAAAASNELTRGVPGKIPVLGLLAVVLAFVLVFSAVTTQPVSTIQRYSGGSYTAGSGINGFDEFRMPVKYRYSNGTEVLTRMDVPNATSYTFSLSYTDSAGTAADAVRYFYVPIRSNRSVTLDGEDFRPTAGMIIHIVLTFGINVTKPDMTIAYVLPGGTLQTATKISGSTDETNTTFSADFEVTETVKLANAIYIIVDRTSQGSSYYPATPLVVSIERKIVEQKSVQTTYIVAAILSLGVAVIDALPLDSSPVRRVTRRRRRRRTTSRRR